MRFLALIAGDPDQRRAVVRAAGEHDLSVALDCQALWVATTPHANVVEIANAGVVVGPLFRAGSPDPVRCLDPGAATDIIDGAGRRLIDAYWGGYVALIAAGRQVTVIRAPFGQLPCLYADAAAGTLLVSDPQLLRAAGVPRQGIDSAALARHLLAGDIRRADTCLSGIRELRGGGRLHFAGGARTEDEVWSPWSFTAETRRIASRDNADHRLRDRVRTCVGSWLTGYDRPLLLLSGGLDSSILAAVLAEAGRDFTPLNIATRNPSGDERHFARAVAARVGRSLVERFNELGHIDPRRSAAALLPRPVARCFEQDSDAWSTAVAAEHGCDVVIDGGGGDNVFCSLQSATPAADCLLDPLGRDRFRQITADIARLAEASRLEVAWRAWRRSRRPRRYRWPIDDRFLTADAASLGPEAIAHPWLDSPRDTLPGRGAHAAIMIPAQGLVEDGYPLRPLSALSPFVSQPLVETCLAIPSWFWFDRGNNRGAARRVFAPLLPQDVAWRRSKGTPDSFLIEILAAFRPAIREMLAEGELVARHLVDRAAILTAIDDTRPARGHDFVRIMQLVDAEAWIASQSD